jgi:hypothetical protein
MHPPCAACSLGEVLQLILVSLGNWVSLGTCLDLTPPDTPQVFEPALFMRAPIAGRPVTSLAFSPDLHHVVFAVVDADASGKVAVRFHESRQSRGEWTVPAPVLASPGFSSGEGWFSADGTEFWFSSNRPPAPAPAAPRGFRVRFHDGAMASPEVVPLEIAADAGVYYPRLLANGDLSFTSRGANGRDDLFVAARRESGFAAPRPLEGEFNSPQDDWDLAETRDGKLRLWVSARVGGMGQADLYYSRRLEHGGWSAPANLRAVNSPSWETAPALTPDDQVLFFLSRADGRERLYWVRLASALEKSS